MGSCIQGATGSVVFTNNISVKIAAISISTGQGTFDVSAFGSGSYVDRIGGGLKDLAGSGSGFVLSDGNPFTFVDNVTAMTITFKTGCTIAFTAIVSNVTVDFSRAGIAVVRFDWSKGDDVDPVITWGTT